MTWLNWNKQLNCYCNNKGNRFYEVKDKNGLVSMKQLVVPEFIITR